jgi:hypothetical protein
MNKKFKGQLADRHDPRVTINWLNRERDLRKWDRDDVENLWLLCDEYGIQPDEHMFVGLTLALARDFVPAFKERIRTGRKKKWTVAHEKYLLIDIERCVEEGSASVAEAARILAEQEPWRSFLEARDKIDPDPNPGEALRRRYNEVKRSKLAGAFRNSYQKDVETHGVEQWLKERDEFFAGNSSQAC